MWANILREHSSLNACTDWQQAPCEGSGAGACGASSSYRQALRRSLELLLSRFLECFPRSTSRAAPRTAIPRLGMSERVVDARVGGVRTQHEGGKKRLLLSFTYDFRSLPGLAGREGAFEVPRPACQSLAVGSR